MFIHNLRYNIKILFNNKVLIFWTFIFPIILGVFFNMAFSNIESDEMLMVISYLILNILIKMMRIFYLKMVKLRDIFILVVINQMLL